MQARGSILVPPMGRGMISAGPAPGHPMAQPQSLLAELRALESKRAQGGLSPPEELRLAELRAVAGHAPAPAAGPRGFDVNAAAAALREELPPVALPPPAPPPPPVEEAPVPPPGSHAGEPAEPAGFAPPGELAGTGTPPGEEATAPARDEGGASALGEVPADWSSWQEPEAGPAPAEEAAASAWDPAVEAAWEAYARERGWDPAAPWDEGTAAYHWDGFLRSMGWVATPADQAADQPVAPEGPAPVEQQVDWSATPQPDLAASPPIAGAAPPAPPGAPAKESDTASWDLGGPAADPGAGPEGRGVPDERDPGTTAQWSLSQVTGGGAPPARAFREEEPEPVILDELQLESEGSFGAGGPAQAAAPAAPAEAEPLEVSDAEIIEVGDEVREVAGPPPGPAAEPFPAADAGAEVPLEELPVVEAVELAELAEEQPLPAPAAAEPPLPAPPPAGPMSFEPVPPEPTAPRTPAADTSPEPWRAASAAAEAAPPEPEPAPPEPLPPQPAPAPAEAPAAPPGGEPVPLESLTIDEEPLVEEPAAPQGRLVPGLHRVVLHTVEGQVMRGVLQDPDLLAAAVALSPQPSAPPEPVAADRLRAIFFMLSPGEKAPDPAGLKVRVTFRDGRQVAGFSRDYDPEAPGFFMVPAESRTNTARIWVYRSAVRQVSVS